MAHSIVLPYGAFELKRVYQRNMLLGMAATVTLIILISFGIWFYSVITYEELPPPDVIVIGRIVDLAPPPSIVPAAPQVKIDQPQEAALKVGIPTPVADDEVADEDITLATREELQKINTPVLDPNAKGTNIIIDIDSTQYMAPPDSFIPMEVWPVCIYEEDPKYPGLAEECGFTGYVVVQAYVDKNGNVSKAMAVKTDRPGMGFEEAAVKAAYKWKYRPGIQNGIPTGCWITYTVKFTMRDR